MKKLIFVLIAALGLSCTSYAQMTEKENLALAKLV